MSTTINHNAKKVNYKLGVVLFDESDVHRLKLLKFTKRYIKELHIDDLIGPDGQGTERLAKLVKEILF